MKDILEASVSMSDYKLSERGLDAFAKTWWSDETTDGDTLTAQMGRAVAAYHKIAVEEAVEAERARLYNRVRDNCGGRVPVEVVLQLLEPPKPAPTFRIGDVVVWDAYVGTVLAVAEDHVRVGCWEVGRAERAHVASLRLATPDEVAAARGEDAPEAKPPMPDAVRALIVRWRSFAQPEFSADECDAFEHAARELEAVYAKVQP